jgi:hypothetical protein
LWTIYEQWGWGTQDAGRALGYLKRFGSVTVLNGHIHQIIQKVEGNVTFHTADSTAFPQPAPGTAPAPGPPVSIGRRTRGQPRKSVRTRLAPGGSRIEPSVPVEQTSIFAPGAADEMARPRRTVSWPADDGAAPRLRALPAVCSL